MTERFQNISDVYFSYRNADSFATSLKPIPRLFAFFNHVSIKTSSKQCKNFYRDGLKRRHKNRGTSI